VPPPGSTKVLIVADGKFTDASFRVPFPRIADRAFVNRLLVWSRKPPSSIDISSPDVVTSSERETVRPVSITTLSFVPGTVEPI